MVFNAIQNKQAYAEIQTPFKSKKITDFRCGATDNTEALCQAF